jgi:hypothetical protein
LILPSISREGESPPCPSFVPLLLFFMGIALRQIRLPIST